MSPPGGGDPEHRAGRARAAPSPDGGAFGAIAIAFGLALALVAVALLQWRQLGLLREAVRSNDDNIVLQVYQAEIEYLQLRELWPDAGRRAALVTPEELRLRYEIWVSRVELLRLEPTRRMLGDRPDFAQTLEAADRFIARADLWFTDAAPPAFDDLAPLRPELEALGPPLHSVVLDAGHHVALQMAARNQAVERHNRFGFALTLFLSALILVFGTVVARQLRAARRQRAELELLAERLRVARHEADAGNRAKSAFLARMSHEIRTPFHGLMGMLALLRETPLAPRQAEYLRTAVESADHLLAILDEVLDLSQLESGRVSLSPSAVDPRRLLHEVEALMRPLAATKGLALHVDAGPDVPERIVADGTRLKQVVFNLLSNAIKFTERGAVSLDLHRRETTPGAPVLECVVRDSGIGMDASTLRELMAERPSASFTATRPLGGAGLGLEISRQLVRLMGGRIDVRSRSGEGSTFVVTLPLQPAHDTVPEPASGDGAAAAVEFTPALRVLVAEDHPVNREYLAALLASLGHEATFCPDGAQAVDALRRGRFDLVLMDLHMPVLDGVAATRAIRALPDRIAAAVPIVALTADAYGETRERCLTGGMNDFLTKPVRPQDLAALLRRLFGVSPGADAADPKTSPAGDELADRAPLVDRTALAAALESIPRERLARLVHDYLDQGEQTAARLRSAVRAAQPLELRVYAHAARGAALNLGLPALAATADALQEGAVHLPAHEIVRLVQRFEDQIESTRSAVIAAGLPAPAALQPAP